MYTEYHEYICKTAKQQLDFEIGKAEGQLRNCRYRMELAKKEMIVGVMAVLVPYLIIKLLNSYPHRTAPAIINYLLFISTGVIVSWLRAIYICLLPFWVYSMVKAIMFYIFNKKEPKVKESLREYTGCTRDIPDPEKNYAIEEDKLIRVLSNYYNYRCHIEELQEKLKEDELTMTAEELQEEIDRMTYFQEIVPSSPFGGKMKTKAKLWTVLICIILLVLIFI